MGYAWMRNICSIIIIHGMSIVEYIKVQHLYRILILPAHVLLSFCVRIGAFDRFLCFCACTSFFEFRAHFCTGSCPKNKCRSSRLMATTVEKPRVVLR